MAWRMLKKDSKYHSEKTTVDGIQFDSKKESRRYMELKLMQKAGLISGLDRQVSFELIPKQKAWAGDRFVTERATKYVADFVYIKDGKKVVEDVKSAATRRKPEYVIKRKLMLLRYGLVVKEV